LLTMGDTVTVEVWSSISLPHVLLIHGQFLQTQAKFFLFNVYAPCEGEATTVGRAESVSVGTSMRSGPMKNDDL
jgi:hypothetical protein